MSQSITTMTAGRGAVVVGVSGAVIALIMSIATKSNAPITWTIIGATVGAGYGALRGSGR